MKTVRRVLATICGLLSVLACVIAFIPQLFVLTMHYVSDELEICEDWLENDNEHY